MTDFKSKYATKYWPALFALTALRTNLHTSSLCGTFQRPSVFHKLDEHKLNC